MTKYKKKLQELLSIISHDIENPLINIEWMSGLLQKKVIQAQQGDHKVLHEDIPQYIDLIQNSTLAIKAQIDGFRDIRQWLFYQAQCHNIHIHSLLTDILQGYDCERMTLNIDPNSIVYADTHSLTKAIQELLNNALHAIQGNSQGHIHISLHHDDAYDVLEIKDNGYGMNEYDIEHVYEPYFSALSKSKAGNSQDCQASHAIGLTIVQAITDNMQGKTWCECSDDGFTHFYLALRETLIHS